MKILFLFLLSFIFVFNLFAATDAEIATQHYKNELRNPGGELGTLGWTASAGTLTADSTAKNDGKASIKFVSGAASRYISTFFYCKKGPDCLARFYYYTSVSDFTASIYEGSNLINSLTIPSGGTSTSFKKSNSLTFIAASATTLYELRVTSGSSATINIDNGYAGENDEKGTYSASYFLGQITWPAASSCAWILTNQTSLASFPADSDCTTPTGGNLIGRVQAPDTKIPAIKIPFGGKGRYVFVATGSFAARDTTNGVSDFSASFRFYDISGAAYSSNSKTLFHPFNSNATSINVWESIFTSVVGEFDLEAFSNKEFEIRGMSLPSSANISARIYNQSDDNNATPLTISVYYYPSESQTVVRSENANQYGNLKISDNGSNQCEYTGNFASMTVLNITASKCTYGYTGNASAGASGNIEFIESNIVQGTYNVKFEGSMFPGNTSTNCNWDIYDGSNVIAYLYGGANQPYSYIGGTVTYSSLQSSKTFQLRTVRTSGASNCYIECGPSGTLCNFSITPVIPTQPMPQIVNSVGTTYSNQVLHESVVIGKTADDGTTCTVNGSCDLFRNTGMFTSASRTNTGRYTLNFTGTGKLPTCGCSSDGNLVPCNVNAESNTSLQAAVYNNANTTYTDTTVKVWCDFRK